MLVSTFVIDVKQRCQVSDPSNTTDQVSQNIISFLNNRMYQIWRSWPWSWLWVPINFNTVPNQSIYSIIGSSDTPGQKSNVGGIVALTTAGGGYLVRVSYKRYLQWLASTELNPVTQQPLQPPIGVVTNYVNVGRDAQQNIQILLWQTPSQIFTITGYGKQRITPHVLSDIGSGKSINYFPDEFCDVLELGVEADIYDTIGQEKNQTLSESMFQAELTKLKSEESDDEDMDATTAPPDTYIYSKRGRGGTSVL